MKATELMIGDLVRMRRIDVENATYYTSKVICLAKDGFLEYEPIPLTVEILKANGIPYNGELPYPCDHIKIRHNDSGWFFTFCECYGFDVQYVHELQHALRLCGLNDLADNFKV